MKGYPSNVDVQALPAKPRKPQQAHRTWLRFDADGSALVFEADKHEIMHRAGIHARDLRILDPFLSYPSTILGREKAIVVNLEHIKAIITAEEVLLRNGQEEAMVPLVEEFKRRLNIGGIGSDYDSDTNRANASPPQAGPGHERAPADDAELLPFEFRALEVALEAACSFLDARTTELESEAYPVLDELTNKVSSLNLEKVRRMKSRMTRLSTRVHKVRDELEQLLDDDDDMAELYLSRKQAFNFSALSSPRSPHSPSLAAADAFSASVASKTYAPRTATHTTRSTGEGAEDVEELEMLLEVYYSQIDVTLNKLNTLREYIDDTEDYVNIQLDHVRNQLIRVEMIMSVTTALMAIASAVAGTFGMNIPFTYNEQGPAFKWVVIITTLCCIALFAAVMAWLRYKRLIGV